MPDSAQNRAMFSPLVRWRSIRSRQNRFRSSLTFLGMATPRSSSIIERGQLSSRAKDVFPFTVTLYHTLLRHAKVDLHARWVCNRGDQASCFLLLFFTHHPDSGSFDQS